MIINCVYTRLLVCLCTLWCCWFFFFKQKTAYEMRISDWSSDVCSSDLVKTAVRQGVVVPIRAAVAFAEPAKPGIHQGLAAHHQTRAEVGGQIGRASCRERVCQYV